MVAKKKKNMMNYRRVAHESIFDGKWRFNTI